MSCYHPLSAFDTGLKTSNGKTKYVIRPEGTLQTRFYGRWLGNPKLIPCGRCIGCRLSYASSWSKRLMLEKTLYPDDQCHFITLTFDDEHFGSPILDKRDWQLFMKRLRKHYGSNVRFFMCGEYGGQTFRKHMHAIVFGLSIPDLVPIHKLDPQSLMTSKTVESIWKNGNVAIGKVTLESCNYVARYVLKKQSFTLKDKPLVEPFKPFVLMSRKPGIGARAFDLKWFANNEIIISGNTFRPGKFFNDMFEKLGYERDVFKILDEEATMRKVDSSDNYFNDLHSQEVYKIAETKILKQRNIEKHYG